MIPLSDEGAGLRYRPEVDGLRAVAVLAVVLFHAGLGVPGGYIGVDVFFVISGYLITSLIRKDLAAGRFSFAGFWARRARRILPALVVVVVAVLALGWFLLLPDDYASLGKAALWQSFFAANFYAWMDTGYFVPAADQKPPLHLWSLAVEEQFYFLFPAFMVAFWGKGRQTWTIFKIALGAGILASFAFSVYTVAFHRGVAFYMLPSRAWELGLGAAVAVMPDRAIPRGGWAREGLAWAGLGAILASCFLLTDETPFPGLAALPACMGTAAVIVACARTPETALPSAGRLLALRPVVFVGLISYSLYLWHWPLFAFANYWAFDLLPLWLRSSLMVVGFGLAVLSWKFVEIPARASRRAKKPSFVLPLAGIVLVALALLGAAVWLADGVPGRPIGKVADVYSPKASKNWLVDSSAEDVRAGRFFELGVPGGKVSVVLWGDSHAMAAAPALDALLARDGLTGVLFAHSSTPPIPGLYWPSKWATRKETLEFNAAVLEYVLKSRPQLVVLVGAWQSYGTNDSDGEIPPALLDTVETLRAHGQRTAVMLQVPHHNFYIPKAVALSRGTGFDLSERLTAPGEFSATFRDPAPLAGLLAKAGCEVVDPLPAFEGGPDGKYIIERDDILLYRDGSHLSEQGAIHMLAPLLAPLMEPLFAPSPSPMKTSIIVTSIAPPTRAMAALAEGARVRGWPLLCMGDLASPSEYVLAGCRFLSLDDQSRLPFQLAEIAPTRHYTRKNLGYLLAAAEGAEVLLETDDDNSPCGSFWDARSRRVGGRTVRAPGWVNAYAYFTKAPVWPRGFPLENLHDPAPTAVAGAPTDCPIQQGLANGDPDVDAVYRLTRELPLHFEDAPPLILGPSAWCPFNSQNTTWWREAFPLLYLPSTCSFRMTDIWRSFVAQRCAWAAGWCVSFHSASVYQDRNEHDLLKDFEQEIPGYLNNSKIARALAALDLASGPGNLIPSLSVCYEALIGLGVIGGNERPLLRAWCADIEALGF